MTSEHSFSLGANNDSKAGRVLRRVLCCVTFACLSTDKQEMETVTSQSAPLGNTVVESFGLTRNTENLLLDTIKEK